jgi:hypothetical protein
MMGKSPHANERSKVGLKSAIGKNNSKQGSKVAQSKPDGLLHGDAGPQKPDSADGVAKQAAAYRVQEG